MRKVLMGINNVVAAIMYNNIMSIMTTNNNNNNNNQQKNRFKYNMYIGTIYYYLIFGAKRPMISGSSRGIDN